MKKTTLLVVFSAAAAMHGCRVYQPGVPSRSAYVERQQRAAAAPERRQSPAADSVAPVSVKPVSASASSFKPVVNPSVGPAPSPSFRAVADYGGASSAPARRGPAAAPRPAVSAPVETVNARPEYAGTGSGLAASHAPGASISAPARPAPTAGGYRIYTVQPGDSVGRIANANGMTLSEFTALNDISDPDRIRVGQTVKVAVGRAPVASSAPTAAPAPAAQPSGGVYVVREGDCLSRIASRHGLTSAQLMEYNSLKDANHITVGQKLRLSPVGAVAAPAAPAPAVPVPAAPAPAPSSAAPAPAVPAFPERTEYGKVVSGNAPVPGTDSTIDEILENGLIDLSEKPAAAPAQPASDAAAPVQPSNDSGVATYTVGANEDIYNVAEKFNSNPLKLRQLNPNCEIKPGAVIRVPVND